MRNFLKQKNNKNKGFTLVETLIGLSIFTTSILALMSVLASGVADTNYAKQKIVAGYLAQEGIEHARNIRDTAVLYDTSGAQHGWNAFKTTNVSYPITNASLQNFTRTVTMNTTGFGADEVRVTSTVTWTQSSGVFNISFSEDLFNWVE